MVETAARLVDHVFPRVPVRRWVLSFPWPLRLLFAARPEVLTRVLTIRRLVRVQNFRCVPTRESSLSEKLTT